MAKFRRTNPLALAVLALLTERPMHPYEMASLLRTRGKEQSIKLNYGSLYTVVESLQRHGLITPREVIREGRRPERTVYEITDAGEGEFVDWLSQMFRSPVKEYTQFEAALSLAGGLPPDEVVDLLKERATALELRLAASRAVFELAAKRGIPRLFMIEGEFSIAMTEAELDFVRSLVGEIRDGSLGGIDFWRKVHQMRAEGGSNEEIQDAIATYLKGGDWA